MYTLRDRLFRLCLAITLLGATACDPAAKVFRAGPFSGQVVDSETGQPVPGAFVGFHWSGQSAIHGSIPCLLAVLVQADAEGRYQVPWQGDRLKTSGAVNVGWTEEVWAPGYVLLKTGEGNLLRAGIVKAAQDPGTSVGQGIDEAKREQSTKTGTKNVVIPLQRAASVMDALERTNRLNSDNYTCGMNENTDANSDVQLVLTLAQYRDSYHKFCEEEPPDEALTQRYWQLMLGDLQSYLVRYSKLEYHAYFDQTFNDKWMLLEQKTGWTRGNAGRELNTSPFDRALLPEFCRLQRFEPALLGNQP